MSQNLGNKLPEKTFNILAFTNSTRKNSAIFLLTEDNESYPHVALLSPYQVVAFSMNRMLVAVYSNSASCRYLSSNGKGTLIIQVEPAVQYVRCTFSESEEEDYASGKQGEKLFVATIVDVLEDFSENAPFISELIFDESGVLGPYREGFQRLSKISENLQA